jgi:predicted nucleic acid-binding protein
LTGVADTRLLITWQFPPTEEIKEKTLDLIQKEIGRHLFAPSILLTEFIKIAGSIIGEDATRTRMRLLEERGFRMVPLDVETASVAGSLLLANRNIPISDALIAAYVKTGEAEYVVTDDPHYRVLGVKTRWL